MSANKKAENVYKALNKNKTNYINSLTSEQKYKIYSEKINKRAIHILLKLNILFLIPAELVNMTMPKVNVGLNDPQLLYNIGAYIIYVFISGLIIKGINLYCKGRHIKNRLNNDEQKMLEKIIDESFLDLPANKMILSEFKKEYGSRKLQSILKKNKGNISNRLIQELIKEQIERNKYKRVVDAL